MLAIGNIKILYPLSDDNHVVGLGNRCHIFPRFDSGRFKIAEMTFKAIQGHW